MTLELWILAIVQLVLIGSVTYLWYTATTQTEVNKTLIKLATENHKAVDTLTFDLATANSNLDRSRATAQTATRQCQSLTRELASYLNLEIIDYIPTDSTDTRRYTIRPKRNGIAITTGDTGKGVWLTHANTSDTRNVAPPTKRTVTNGAAKKGASKTPKRTAGKSTAKKAGAK